MSDHHVGWNSWLSVGSRGSLCKCQQCRRGALVDRNDAPCVMAHIQVVLNYDACVCSEVEWVGRVLARDAEGAAVQAKPGRRLAAAVLAGLGRVVAVLRRRRHGTCDMARADSEAAGPSEPCNCKLVRFIRAADLTVRTHVTACMCLVWVLAKMVRCKATWRA
jgi:hypothetical protein